MTPKLVFVFLLTANVMLFGRFSVALLNGEFWTALAGTAILCFGLSGRYEPREGS